MITTAPKTITKTTMNLQPGDVVLDGNMFIGYTTTAIISVERWDYNKRMATVELSFASGNSAKMNYGINTRWSVLESK
jgi:hypothetical protein